MSDGGRDEYVEREIIGGNSYHKPLDQYRRVKAGLIVASLVTLAAFLTWFILAKALFP